MKTMRMVVVLPGVEMTEDEQKAFKVLMCDAMAEFAKARTLPYDGVEGYVEKRYEWMTPEQREKKVVEVKMRVELAERLRNGFAGLRAVKMDMAAFEFLCDECDGVGCDECDGTGICRPVCDLCKKPIEDDQVVDMVRGEDGDTYHGDCAHDADDCSACGGSGGGYAENRCPHCGGSGLSYRARERRRSRRYEEE